MPGCLMSVLRHVYRNKIHIDRCILHHDVQKMCLLTLSSHIHHYHRKNIHNGNRLSRTAVIPSSASHLSVQPTIFQNYLMPVILQRPLKTNSLLRHVSQRFVSQGKHPVPKVPPTRLMRHYDIHGSISDEDSAKQFIYALSGNERKRLLNELEHFRDLEGKIKEASKPSKQQLKQVALHQTFPFIGFGFLDNLLMICFGEYIDVTLGASLGISTMAAAALGNLLSDVGGIGSASSVENIVTKMGIRAPHLSPEQVEMRITRWASSLGKAIGVTIGCLLGMFPLLFFSYDKDKDKDKEKDTESTDEE